MYAHGWYQIAFERDLAEGITPLSFGDHQLMAVRTPTGLRLFDARCPHRGANLAHGGEICDEGVRCPFHGYMVGFGTPSEDGFAAREHACAVIGGGVFMRLSDREQPDLPAALAELEKEYTFIPGFDMPAGTSIEMVMENGFDNAHFNAVHKILNRPDFSVGRGPHGDLTVDGLFQIPGSAWFAKPGTPAAAIEVPYRAHAYSPGLVISELNGDPPFRYRVLTGAVPNTEPNTCTIRVTLALPTTGGPPHEHFSGALLAASRDGLEKDREIWNRLELDAPSRYTDLDEAVIEFAKFCRDFRQKSVRSAPASEAVGAG